MYIIFDLTADFKQVTYVDSRPIFNFSKLGDISCDV